jgi:hypothetical protein
MFRILGVLSLLVIPACATSGEQSLDRVGDKYEIFLNVTTETSGNGSSGRSNSRYTLIEKVIALRSDGMELEFDLPEDTSLEDRAREWQFPVRVLKREGRPYELLNRQQLQDRVQSWLERWDIPKEACGSWIFTWNAFKIECDPDSVLGALESFDLRYGDLREGALYREPNALEPSRLSAEINRSGRPIYVARMNVDPDAVRRMRAEQAVVVAEILGEDPVTFETALQRLSADRISGTIVTTFETDAVGRITGRTRITEIFTVGEDGAEEREIATETIKRKILNNSE